MDIVAPLSKHKRNSRLVAIAALLGFAGWCAYDGFVSKRFIEAHTDADTGQADDTLRFNRQAPPYLVLGAALIGAYGFVTRGRRIVATDTALVLGKGRQIDYDSIQAIDKTDFKTRGTFTVVYVRDGREARVRLDDRQFDNLQSILNHLIAQIT